MNVSRVEPGGAAASALGERTFGVLAERRGDIGIHGSILGNDDMFFDDGAGDATAMTADDQSKRVSPC